MTQPLRNVLPLDRVQLEISKSGHFKADQLMFVLNHLQLLVPNLGLVSFSIAKRTAALQHALARRCHWFAKITSTE
jgi:hypothetical protein